MEFQHRSKGRLRRCLVSADGLSRPYMSDYPYSPRVVRVWQGYTSHICALPRQGLHVDTHMVEQRTPTQTLRLR